MLFDVCHGDLSNESLLPVKPFDETGVFELTDEARIDERPGIRRRGLGIGPREIVQVGLDAFWVGVGRLAKYRRVALISAFEALCIGDAQILRDHHGTDCLRTRGPILNKIQTCCSQNAAG